MIYVIQAGEGGPVKIGKAKDPQERLRVLQTGNPVKLRLLVAVNMQDFAERRLHEWLEQDRLEGEWFTYTQKVSNVLDDLIIRSSLGPADQTHPDQSEYELAYLRMHYRRESQHGCI